MYSEAEMEQVWELLNVLVEIAVVVHEDVQSGDESETDPDKETWWSRIRSNMMKLLSLD